jgi:hypothetical protein
MGGRGVATAGYSDLSANGEDAVVSKDVVGIHVLMTRLLFGDSISRRLLLRVSPAKPISAPLRF